MPPAKLEAESDKLLAAHVADAIDLSEVVVSALHRAVASGQCALDGHLRGAYPTFSETKPPPAPR